MDTELKFAFGRRSWAVGAVHRLRPLAGIDLGSANTVVAFDDDGVRASEASVVMVDGVDPKRVLRYGHAARATEGRTSSGVRCVRPVVAGAVTDLHATAAFLGLLVRSARPRFWERVRIRSVIAVPVGATQLERQALAEVAEMAGLGALTLLNSPVAGALGDGVDLGQGQIHLAADFGSSTSQLAAFGAGGIVAAYSVRLGGDAMADAITEHLYRERRVAIGRRAAESALIAADGATEGIRVVGRDASNDRIVGTVLDRDEISEVVQPVVTAICSQLAREVMTALPPEAAVDADAGGILAFGGASNLALVRDGLHQATGLRVHQAARPMTCVAEGAAQVLHTPALRAAFAIRG